MIYDYSRRELHSHENERTAHRINRPIWSRPEQAYRELVSKIWEKLDEQTL